MKSNWKEYTVQELIDLGMLEEPLDGNHGSIHPKASDYVDSGVPFIMANNIINGVVDLDGCAFITEEQANTLRKGFAKPGDVLLTHKATIGRTAIVPDKYETIILTPQVTYYRTIKGIDNRYLKYYFDSPFFQETLTNWAGSGSTRAYLGILAQHKLPIILPPYDEQIKIAGLLDLLDKKILVNTEINENLTEQARAVFQSWFIDYEPFGGSVPIDWKLSSLGQIATIKTESWSPAKNPNVVVEHYSIPAFDELHFPVFEIASGIKSNKYILTSDSVMISKLNPDTKRIWRPFCLSEYPVCSTEFIVYEAKKQGQKDYIYSIMDSIPFLNHLCSHTTGSTNSRQRATPKNTLDFALYLPPDSIIKDFCQIVTPIYDLIASHTIENQSLAKLRDSLLPRLMSGELDVSNLDI